MSIIVWFRRDLRVQDNPALAYALADARLLRLPVTGVYVHDPEGVGSWQPGGASTWYLDRTLRLLQADLAQLGIPLCVRRGGVIEQMRLHIGQSRCERVYWNRVVEPGQEALDDALRRSLFSAGLVSKIYDDDCLLMPEQLRRDNGNAYRMFTPFWRKAQALLATQDFNERLFTRPNSTASRLPTDPGLIDKSALLRPVTWHRKLESHWSPGEHAALDLWQKFFDQSIHRYHLDRDRPDLGGTSQLSAALHFGEISVARLYMQCQQRLATEKDESARAGILRLLAELGWREFARHTLHAWPDLPNRSLDRRFEQAGAWELEPKHHWLRAWQRGETGYDLVDAGMRELWQTGRMHNRVRMVAASFLTKNLGIHWREGASWFWDTLVDADFPNNTLGWQWVAGCGTDAAPYYRIFNPETQAKKFDPQGVYRKRWLPKTPRPKRLIELQSSRSRALARYQSITKGHAA